MEKGNREVCRGGLVRVLGLVSCLALVASSLAAEKTAAAGADLAKLFAGGEPTSVAELKAMEKHQQALAEKVMAVTVGIVVGPAHGSGVIISEDGYVLTAAHVVGKPSRPAIFILPDGRTVRGATLGAYRTLDAGLMKITQPGKWPHAEMAKADTVEPGEWCMATGHPGGYENKRNPVVRLGRVMLKDKLAITSDCTLVGGDSGGPLFDMDGRVIGIHSRIGRFLTANMHVPVTVFREQWGRLAKGEVWGHLPGTGPYVGVQGEPSTEAAKIARVLPGAPAEKAGIRVGDVVVSYGGKKVTDFASLQALVSDSDPGDKVPVEVLRDGKKLRLELVVGKQPEPKER